MGVSIKGVTMRGLRFIGQEWLEPTQISLCTTWYQWKTGITVDGSNNVSSWGDSGGSDNIPLEQSTAIRRPAYNPTTGQILFDGSNDYLRSATLPLISSGGLEITIVVEARQSIGIINVHRVRNTAADTDGLIFSQNTAGRVTKSIKVGSGVIVHSVDGSTPLAGTKCVLTLRYTRTLYVNGVEVAYAVRPSAGGDGYIDLSTPRWCLGAIDANSGGNPTTPGDYSNVAIYEMCAHNKALSALERTKMVNYFKVKHQIL